jgi:hypothetical protein
MGAVRCEKCCLLICNITKANCVSLYFRFRSCLRKYISGSHNLLFEKRSVRGLHTGYRKGFSGILHDLLLQYPPFFLPFDAVQPEYRGNSKINRRKNENTTLPNIEYILWAASACRGFCIELSLYYGRRSVDQFVLVSGLPLGPMTRFIFLFFFFFLTDNYFLFFFLWDPL